MSEQAQTKNQKEAREILAKYLKLLVEIKCEENGKSTHFKYVSLDAVIDDLKYYIENGQDADILAVIIFGNILPMTSGDGQVLQSSTEIRRQFNEFKAATRKNPDES